MHPHDFVMRASIWTILLAVADPVAINNMTISCLDGSCKCVGDQPATLTCEASGFPAPTYKWSFENEYISGNETIEATYDGTYFCTATNRYGGSSFNATVSVNVSDCDNSLDFYPGFNVSTAAVDSTTAIPTTKISTTAKTTTAEITTRTSTRTTAETTPETTPETTNETTTETTMEITTETTNETTTETTNETANETTTETTPETTMEITTETTMEITTETTNETTTKATEETTPETAIETTIEATTKTTKEITTETKAEATTETTQETASETTNETTEATTGTTTETTNETTAPETGSGEETETETISETTPETTAETETTAEITTQTTTQTTTTTAEPTTTVSPSSTTPTVPTSTTTTSTLSTTSPTTKPTTTPYDPCDPSPCRNGATCVDNGATFTCICTAGFTSQRCDVEINECEANPCYPFGKCTDLIAEYNCSCNPGYEPVPNNTKMCNETDFCAKEDIPCYNGGTCVNQNALSRYYCICPVFEDKQYVGLLCETELITKPIVNGGISPTSGIIAGGANVTMRGQGLNLFEPLGAYLIDTTSSPLPSLYAYVIFNLTFSDSITVRVPPVEDTYVDCNLLMIVEYSGPINVTSDADNLRFKYTGNPVIQAIEPTEILMSGGVRLTVSGSNMDTVQNPMMDITTFVVNTTGHSETNYSRESCALKNVSAITCLVPNGIVPSSFINNTQPAGKRFRGVFHLDSSLWDHKRGRRTKRAPVANLTDETGNTFEMYLGFIFDEFPTYTNISKSLPNVTLNFVPIQVSFNSGCAMDFVTNKMETISLSGSGLLHGCSMDDYQVFVSDALCNVTMVTDNELQCRPPNDEPLISDNSSFCVSTSDPHPVKVIVAGTTHHGCCVSYTTDYTDLIIGVTVICVVVVAIIILVVVLLYRRYRKSDDDDDDDVTILTYLRNKLQKKTVKRENIYVNHDAPQQLVEEAINHAVRNDNNNHPRDFHQPSVTGQRSPAAAAAAAADYDYSIDDDAATSRRHRSPELSMNPGRTVVDIAQPRRYPTDTRNLSLTDDDYMQPRDNQFVFDNNDGIIDNPSRQATVAQRRRYPTVNRNDDYLQPRDNQFVFDNNDGRIDIVSGRTRDSYGYVGGIGEPAVEVNGSRPISQPDINFLSLEDMAMHHTNETPV